MNKPPTEVPLPRPFTFLLPGETWRRPVDAPRIDCYSDKQMISQYEAGRAAGAAEERDLKIEVRLALYDCLQLMATELGSATGPQYRRIKECIARLNERAARDQRTQSDAQTAAPIAASPAQPGQQKEPT